MNNLKNFKIDGNMIPYEIPTGYGVVNTGLVKVGDLVLYPFDDDGEFNPEKNWTPAEEPDHGDDSYSDIGIECALFYGVVRKLSDIGDDD